MIKEDLDGYIDDLVLASRMVLRAWDQPSLHRHLLDRQADIQEAVIGLQQMLARGDHAEMRNLIAKRRALREGRVI